MMTTLDPEDLQAIADRVIEVLRPLRTVVDREEETIFDKEALARYRQSAKKGGFHVRHNPSGR